VKEWTGWRKKGVCHGHAEQKGARARIEGEGGSREGVL
jgi:hypothetical protein